VEVVISIVMNGRVSRQRRMTGIAEIPSPAIQASTFLALQPLKDLGFMVLK